MSNTTPSIAALALRLERTSYLVTYIDKPVPPEIVVELLGSVVAELHEINTTPLERALQDLCVDVAYEKAAAALAIGELAANCDDTVVIDLEPRPFAVRFNDPRTKQYIPIIRNEVES